MTVCLMSITGPYIVQAAPSTPSEVVIPEIKDASPEAQAMITRLNEIKAMDFKHLSSSERKALRHELKDMKKNHVVTGIYLSVGAIIVILLILLLVL